MTKNRKRKKGLRTFSIMHTKLIADPISTWSSPEPRMKASGTTTWRFTKCDMTPVDVDTWNVDEKGENWIGSELNVDGIERRLLNWKTSDNRKQLISSFRLCEHARLSHGSFRWLKWNNKRANSTLIDVVCKVKKLLKTFLPLIRKIASVWQKALKQKFTTLRKFSLRKKGNGKISFASWWKSRTKRLREKSFAITCIEIFILLHWTHTKRRSTGFLYFFCSQFYFDNERWSNQT